MRPDWSIATKRLSASMHALSAASPSNVAIAVPLFMSRTFRARSADAETARFPFAVTATSRTESRVTAQLPKFPSSFQVPQLQRPV